MKSFVFFDTLAALGGEEEWGDGEEVCVSVVTLHDKDSHDIIGAVEGDDDEIISLFDTLVGVFDYRR